MYFVAAWILHTPMYSVQYMYTYAVYCPLLFKEYVKLKSVHYAVINNSTMLLLCQNIFICKMILGLAGFNIQQNKGQVTTM